MLRGKDRGQSLEAIIQRINKHNELTAAAAAPEPFAQGNVGAGQGLLKGAGCCEVELDSTEHLILPANVSNNKRDCEQIDGAVNQEGSQDGNLHSIKRARIEAVTQLLEDSVTQEVPSWTDLALPFSAEQQEFGSGGDIHYDLAQFLDYSSAVNDPWIFQDPDDHSNNNATTNQSELCLRGAEGDIEGNLRHLEPPNAIDQSELFLRDAVYDGGAGIEGGLGLPSQSDVLSSIPTLGANVVAIPIQEAEIAIMPSPSTQDILSLLDEILNESSVNKNSNVEERSECLQEEPGPCNSNNVEERSECLQEEPGPCNSNNVEETFECLQEEPGPCNSNNEISISESEQSTSRDSVIKDLLPLSRKITNYDTSAFHGEWYKVFGQDYEKLEIESYEKYLILCTCPVDYKTFNNLSAYFDNRSPIQDAIIKGFQVIGDFNLNVRSGGAHSPQETLLRKIAANLIGMRRIALMTCFFIQMLSPIQYKCKSELYKIRRDLSHSVILPYYSLGASLKRMNAYLIDPNIKRWSDCVGRIDITLNALFKVSDKSVDMCAKEKLLKLLELGAEKLKKFMNNVKILKILDEEYTNKLRLFRKKNTEIKILMKELSDNCFEELAQQLEELKAMPSPDLSEVNQKECAEGSNQSYASQIIFKSAEATEIIRELSDEEVASLLGQTACIQQGELSPQGNVLSLAPPVNGLEIIKTLTSEEAALLLKNAKSLVNKNNGSEHGGVSLPCNSNNEVSSLESDQSISNDLDNNNSRQDEYLSNAPGANQSEVLGMCAVELGNDLRPVEPPLQSSILSLITSLGLVVPMYGLQVVSAPSNVVLAQEVARAPEKRAVNVNNRYKKRSERVRVSVPFHSHNEISTAESGQSTSNDIVITGVSLPKKSASANYDLSEFHSGWLKVFGSEYEKISLQRRLNSFFQYEDTIDYRSPKSLIAYFDNRLPIQDTIIEDLLLIENFIFNVRNKSVYIQQEILLRKIAANLIGICHLALSACSFIQMLPLIEHKCKSDPYSIYKALRINIMNSTQPLGARLKGINAYLIDPNAQRWNDCVVSAEIISSAIFDAKLMYDTSIKDKLLKLLELGEDSINKFIKNTKNIKISDIDYNKKINLFKKKTAKIYSILEKLSDSRLEELSQELEELKARASASYNLSVFHSRWTKVFGWKYEKLQLDKYEKYLVMCAQPKDCKSFNKLGDYFDNRLPIQNVIIKGLGFVRDFILQVRGEGDAYSQREFLLRKIAANLIGMRRIALMTFFFIQMLSLVEYKCKSEPFKIRNNLSKTIIDPYYSLGASLQKINAYLIDPSTKRWDNCMGCADTILFALFKLKGEKCIITSIKDKLLSLSKLAKETVQKLMDDIQNLGPSYKKSNKELELFKKKNDNIGSIIKELLDDCFEKVIQELKELKGMLNPNLDEATQLQEIPSSNLDEVTQVRRARGNASFASRAIFTK